MSSLSKNEERKVFVTVKKQRLYACIYNKANGRTASDVKNQGSRGAKDKKLFESSEFFL